MKILVTGFSGSGKSYLAKKLADHFDLPLLYLDNVQFYGDWQERTLEEKNQIVRDFLAKNDSWVIDGNYSNVAPERFALSDITIYLKYNRVFCYSSCLKRYFKHIGKKRESLGCIEKFDLEFQWWILFKGRTKKIKQQHLNNLYQSKGEKLIFKNRRSLNKYLKIFLKEN